MTIDSKKRVVIKIGSSSLTSRHGEISRRKLEKLVEEIVQLKDEGHEVSLVSSGAVAAGYRKLGLNEKPNTLPEKQASASIGQSLLMEVYSEYFLSHGYVASQILITRDDFLNEDRYNNARNTINLLLDHGIVPIINENDTVTVNRIRFGDNDTLSAKVAALIDADMLIILSDIDGLYDGDPRKHLHTKRLEHVHEITPSIEAAAGDSGSAVGTGGMKSKMDAFKIAMASGIPAFLGKAGTPNILRDAVMQKAKGTYFTSNKKFIRLNSKKQWIAFHSGPRGEVMVDEAGKVVIVEKKGCLQLANIKDVKGHFNKGEVVKILHQNGKEIGLGIINYSSEQLADPKDLSEKESIPAVDSNHLVCHLGVSTPINI
ncbi:glutamate 5-kinase [Neobacillus bataviensis]|uniref:Glutamate 5-kinase n=1 Tax=Neobacillus bataviensis TaxID=220685 RepID=A0A561CZZ4_9BACI|nr:glutamate 5-kinase [Neobacillus bataviensis]TWD96388.1 glutamate 5-kinase [Neobacillus bataviensis]